MRGIEATVICNHCDCNNPAGARFCAGCGAELAAVCPTCGAGGPPGAKYCVQCGAFLAEPAAPAGAGGDILYSGAERRQLTVMFCDLAGSTELATRFDPEELGELNRLYRGLCETVIHRFDGYIARYMGDGVLAYFGYPRAHEDDPERAVRAALELTARAPGLDWDPGSGAIVQVRVGIATGPVVVGELIGEGAARERDVVGETPNLAARLQGLAGGNEVVVSDDTRKLTGGAFTVEGLGEREIKGFPRALLAWRVCGARALETRFEAAASPAPTPFVGREHEIALVLDAFGRAARGDGQVVLLCGEPGIGKSRIMQALREQLGSGAAVTIRCQSSPWHTGTPLHPVVEHLKRAAKLDDGGGAGSRLDRLEQIVDPEHRLGPHRLSLFANLVSLPPGDHHRGVLAEPEVLRERTLEAILASLEDIASRQPLLVLFEDVHWADPTTIELIGALVERIARWPAMMMITFRPEFSPPWAGGAHVSLLTLKRLDRHQCRTIVTALAGGRSMPEELHRQILERTDGVPLFVEELTRTIIDSGLLVERGDAYELAGALEPPDIPATLKDSLMARLDQLDDAKSLAQLGAVIGREFSEPLLTAVSGLPREDVRAAMERLGASQLVFPRGSGRRTTYVFKHALVRDAAYASLLKSRRRALHGRIAEVLCEQFADLVEAEPEVVARHFDAAGRHAEALEYFTRAARQLAARSAYREAIVHFEKALAIAVAGNDAEAAARITALKVSLAECLRVVERIDEALEQLAEAEQEASRFGLDETLAKIHYQRGNLYFPFARIDDCLAEHRRAIEFARRAGSAADEVRALGGLGDAYYASGRMRTARESFGRCVELARAHGMNDTVAANLSMVGFSRIYLLEITEAMADGTDAIAAARTTGNRRAEMLGCVIQTLAHCLRGEYAQSLEWAARSESLTDDLGARRFMPQNRYYRALALVGLGRREEALNLLDEAEAAARESSRQFSLSRVLGAIALATDDDERRRRALAEGERLLDEGAVAHNHFAFCLDATDSCFDHTEWEAMRHYADLLQRYTRNEPLPLGDFIITRARALAAWGAGERGDAARRELEHLARWGREAGFLSPLSRIELALVNAP